MHEIGNIKRFLRIALLAPLVVPLLLWLVAPPQINGAASEVVMSFVWIMVLSLPFGGIPYAIFYVVIWRVMNRLNRRGIIILLWLLPLLFYVWCLVLGIVINSIAALLGAWGFVAEMTTVAWVYLYIFPVGYLYVFLTMVLMYSAQCSLRFFHPPTRSNV